MAATSSVGAKAALYVPSTNRTYGSSNGRRRGDTASTANASSATLADPTTSYPSNLPRSTVSSSASALSALRAPTISAFGATSRDWNSERTRRQQRTNETSATDSTFSSTPSTTADTSLSTYGFSSRRKQVESSASASLSDANKASSSSSSSLTRSARADREDGNTSDSHHIATQSHRTRIPRLHVSSATSVTPPRAARNAALVTAPAVVESRDSMYSSTSSLGESSSAVVSTANAVNIERLTYSPRTLQSAAARSPNSSPSANIDKGIGVKTRRKSRESSSSERRKPRSGRNSLTTTNSTADETSRIIVPRTLSPLKQLGNASSLDRLSPLGVADTTIKETVQMKRDLSGSSIASHLSAERPPCGAESNASASLSTALKYTPKSAGSGARDGWSSSSVADTLDPLSDAWGQNSTVAGQSFEDDGLSSIDAFSAHPIPASPLTPHSTAAARQYDLARGALGKTGGAAHATRHRQLSSHYRSEGATTPQTSRNASAASNAAHDQDDKRKNSAPMLDIKDSLLTQLLASMSLVDAQSYPVMTSLDEVEALKRTLKQAERRIGDMQHKLKVQMRMRDAADKLRRAAGPRSRSGTHARTTSTASAAAGTHQRRISSTSNVDVPQHLQHDHAASAAAEADVAQATRTVDQISRELMEQIAEAGKLRKRLLEHHAGVLAVRVVALENEVQGAQTRAADDEDEKAKVGAMMAADELDNVRDQLARVKQMLEHERQDRAAEVQRWRNKHEEDTRALFTRHDNLVSETELQSTRLVEQHALTLAEERRRVEQLEHELKAQEEELAQRERDYDALRMQMEQLEFETTAERNIMLQRQNLFSAFEQRLERAERRLREQDERCARLLGKAEGREEMDDLLHQIKYGADGAARKEKTAGQDIDELLDSLTMHINDMEDELTRAAHARMYEGETSLGVSSHGDVTSGGSLSVRDAGAVRELAVELQTSQREADEWRTQAESAKRHLATLQRQSHVSMTSTSARLSVVGAGSPSNFGGRRPSTTFSRLASSRSAAELEARVALLEKRNASLETELAYERDATRIDASLDRSPPSKVAGISFGVGGRKVSSASSYADTVKTLLNMLPDLQSDVTDLHEVQEELESMPRNSNVDVGASNAEEVCRIVVERTRSVLFVGRSLVGKALTLEMERRDFDEDVREMESEHEQMKVAMEDMRSGHAQQLQIIEASKARERALEQLLDEARRMAADVPASEKSPTMAMRPSPSLTSLISSQAGGSASTIAQRRRNVVPVRGGRKSIGMMMSRSAGNSTAATPVPSPSARPTALPLSISPSSSKLSFTSTAITTSTPATSHPAWSPAGAQGMLAVPGGMSTSSSSDLTGTEQHLPTFAALNQRQAATQRSLSGPSGSPASRQTVAASITGTLQQQRSMMLGMGTAQMMERIRQLENDLVRAKQGSQRTNAEEQERARMEAQLDAFRAELDENRREMDEIRNVESRQRIELLEELTSLTSELSDARLRLREQERRTGHQILKQKTLNV